MREIKFRAWDKDYKYMNHKVMIGNVWDEDNYHAHMIWIDAKDVDYERESGWMNFDEHSNIELMQYTGLKDKNGKEIYEGDVLKREDFPDEKPQFIVRFGEFTESPDLYHEIECLGWYVERIGKHDKYNTSLMYVIDMLDGIVCGNIYENPELLGDSQ